MNLVEYVREATKLKVILSPRDFLPIRANLAENNRIKRIKVEYSPGKCNTGDLAYELLRGLFIALGERNGSLLRASSKAGSNDNLSVSWINSLLSVRWVINELKLRGLRVGGLLKDYLENNLIYLDLEGEAYSHIADRDRRRIYSAVNFAIYLITRGDVDYGEAGSKFDELYRNADPEGVNVGSKAAAIIDSGPLSWEGVRATAGKLMELFNLDRDKVEIG
ncbi:MAG: hypothetical protein QXE79_02990 [Candidatus Bathyarchaeia archaeon]